MAKTAKKGDNIFGPFAWSMAGLMLNVTVSAFISKYGSDSSDSIIVVLGLVTIGFFVIATLLHEKMYFSRVWIKKNFKKHPIFFIAICLALLFIMANTGKNALSWVGHHRGGPSVIVVKPHPLPPLNDFLVKPNRITLEQKKRIIEVLRDFRTAGANIQAECEHGKTMNSDFEKWCGDIDAFFRQEKELKFKRCHDQFEDRGIYHPVAPEKLTMASPSSVDVWWGCSQHFPMTQNNKNVWEAVEVRKLNLQDLISIFGGK
jgi:hypothetical protein